MGPLSSPGRRGPEGGRAETVVSEGGAGWARAQAVREERRAKGSGLHCGWPDAIISSHGDSGDTSYAGFRG